MLQCLACFIHHALLIAACARGVNTPALIRALTGEELRWGFEQLNIDQARLQALGAEGLLQPLKLSCADHEGGGAIRLQQWDGQQWKVVSDWVQADRALLRPIIEESSRKYAKEKGITPRDCSKES